MGRRGYRNAVEILKRLQTGELSSEDIDIHERRACVAYLRLEGYGQDEIASIFDVTRQTIYRDERANKKALARLIDEIDAKAVAGGMIASARHLYNKAMKEKDYSLVWRIERELLSDLQGLGYLPKAADKHELHVSTFTDLATLAAEETSVTGHEALPEPGDGQDEDGAAEEISTSGPDALPEPGDAEEERESDDGQD